MKLFFQADFDTHQKLTGEEAFHAIKVLRIKIGDEIYVTDGCGGKFQCQIVAVNKNDIQTQVISTQIEAPLPYSIHICVAPTKNMDRLEWFVEKATEIGIQRISFFFAEQSERKNIKLDRLQKIAISAMKQSLQSFLPELLVVDSFEKLIVNNNEDCLFLAHLPSNTSPIHLAKATKPNQSYKVLIGPEGDFTQKEINLALSKGFKLVTLGTTRLRTETAALVACHSLQLVNLQ